MTEFDWPVRVYYEDTDAAGLVYHSNYLKYMERARTELLRALGFGKQFIFEREHMFAAHRDELRARIAEGAAQVERGQVSDGPEAVARVRRRIDKRRAGEG